MLVVKPTFRIRDQFNSKAKVIYLQRFYFGDFVYGANTGSDVGLDYDYQRNDGWWPKMPVLIEGNGLPWEIGNAYLLIKLEDALPWEMDTIKNRAVYLLAYLRFLEDTGTHFMHFPTRKSERVTYVFKDTLRGFIASGLNPTYASNIISTVVDFYRTIILENLVSEQDFQNLPFKDVHKFIKFLDGKGFGRHKNVVTSDLAIPHTSPSKRSDRIEDGGQLRPLKIHEQIAILNGFKEAMCPYNLELMMRIALSTGARMQTVCTLRAYHIKKAYTMLQANNASSIEIQAGNGARDDGHLINTKRNKLHRLLFPRKLIEDLYIYLTSEYHQSLIPKSFYGESDLNYLFLTEKGSPFYISKQEIKDRQNSESHWSVNSSDFVQNRGDTVRMNLNKFVKDLRAKNSDLGHFKFHDLRATFGMNLVRKLNDKGYKSAQILTEVRSRLGHSSIETTQQYLDFEQMEERYEEVAVEFEDSLLSNYQSTGN